MPEDDGTESATTNRFCTQCGEPRAASASFCGSCGASFSTDPRFGESAEARSASRQPMPTLATSPAGSLPAHIASPGNSAGPGQVPLATFGQRWGAAFLDQLLMFCTLGVGWVVWCWFTSREGQSPGKKLVGLRVVGQDDGRVVPRGQGFVRAVLRNAFDLLSALLVYIPSGVAAWGFFKDPLRRAPWDRAMHTLVVHDPTGLSTVPDAQPLAGRSARRPAVVYPLVLIGFAAVGAVVAGLLAAGGGDDDAGYVATQAASVDTASSPWKATTTSATTTTTVPYLRVEPKHGWSAAQITRVRAALPGNGITPNTSADYVECALDHIVTWYTPAEWENSASSGSFRATVDSSIRQPCAQWGYPGVLVPSSATPIFPAVAPRNGWDARQLAAARQDVPGLFTGPKPNGDYIECALDYLVTWYTPADWAAADETYGFRTNLATAVIEQCKSWWR